MADKKLMPHHSDNWDGYTLDELRYQRALNMARLEIEKEKLNAGITEMRRGLPTINSGHGILSKIAGSLSYIDYAVLAFRIFRTVSKAFRGLRRR